MKLVMLTITLISAIIWLDAHRHSGNNTRCPTDVSAQGTTWVQSLFFGFRRACGNQRFNQHGDSGLPKQARPPAGAVQFEGAEVPMRRSGPIPEIIPSVPFQGSRA
jgi:hypothetical protein